MKKILLSSLLFLSGFSFGQVPSYVPTNGLVGWWGFNGNANDESGNGNNGSVNGATLTSDRFGNTNNAYSFDGINDYISVVNTVINNTQGSSISIWVKTTTSITNSYQCFFYEGVPGEYHLASGATGVYGQLEAGVKGADNSWYGVYFDLNNYVNLWQHFVFNYSNNTIDLYVDGVYFGSTSNSSGGIWTPTLDQTNFGARRVTGTVEYPLNGCLDDIGIWNRALTQCEIEALYNAQVANLSVNAGPDASICNGNELTLSATANSGSTQTMDVSASSSTDYTFSGAYTGADPNITAEVGDTLVFNVNSPSHPFWIKTDPVTGTSSAVSVANNGTGNGTISWVPDTPGTYYYICQFHSGMLGTITINASSTSITWNNGVTDGVPFTPLTSAYYTATATTGSCAVSDSLFVTLLQPTTSSITETVCDTYTAPDGSVYTTTGNYTAVIPNAQGCDSTITIDLTITNSNTGLESVTECDSYTWSTNGQTYTQSGQYTEVLTNQVGCDSTVTLNLTITNSNTGSETVTECDSYTWNTNGQTYTQSGQYTEVLTNQVGCDSTVTLNLTITNSNTGSETVTECDSYTWNSNGQTYTQSGQYTEVLTNQVGCDSTVTLNLTINSSSSSTQTDSGLDSYTWSVNNQTYTQSGTYTAVIPNASGCDSTITLDLTLQFTGLDENESSYVAVYPNPTFNTFTLSTKDMINMNYTLLDNQGKVVLTGKIESTEQTVDISKLSKGQYNLVFEDESIRPISIIKN